MPRIDDQAVLEKRPFKKKPYRPWNLLDDDVPSSPTEKQIQAKETTQEMPLNIEVIKKESISNQSVTENESHRNQIVTKPLERVNQQDTNSNRISNRFSNQSIVAETPQSGLLNDVTSASQEVQRIYGLQRKILFYIVEDCIFRGELFTNPISTESLKNLTNADKDTVKTATQRLINKNMVTRGYGKKGRGGFAIFHITEQIRAAVIAVQKQTPSSSQLVTNWLPKKEPLSTISSSSNLINTTTKSDEIFFTESSVWESLDLEPLNQIGFTKSHLRQIIMDDKLQADMVQESIFAFAFDLENNGKEKNLKSNPLNYFMGILRSGKPYAPPANYESPQDKALRVYLERKKELEQKRQAMEEELFLIAFKEWDVKLTEEEKDSILPANIKHSRLLSDKISALRLHFKENIWPKSKDEYLKSIN